MKILIVLDNVDRTGDCIVTSLFGVLTLVCLYLMLGETEHTGYRIIWGALTLLCDFMTAWGALVLCMRIYSSRGPRPGGGIPFIHKQTTPQDLRGRCLV